MGEVGILVGSIVGRVVRSASLRRRRVDTPLPGRGLAYHPVGDETGRGAGAGAEQFTAGDRLILSHYLLLSGKEWFVW
jgi:hypothetical protein